MIRICMRCGGFMGEKPPFEDQSETHGICDECWPKEHERLKKQIGKSTSGASGQDKPDHQ
jgi:hypothetical protein